MTAAIFGLVGVIVGGVLSFATTTYLQHRRDRSHLRSIARLAYDDCLHFQSTLVRALATQSWWTPGEEISPQVNRGDRKFLLGELDDAISQEVAAAIGWAKYLSQQCAKRAKAVPTEAKGQGGSSRGQSPPENKPATDAELFMMRDTFCRLDHARWALSGKRSGRHFQSFRDGAVLTTLDPPRTLEELEICEARCRERRKLNYGRETTP